PDGSMRKGIIKNAMALDSLDYELRLREQYLQNVLTIISGKQPESYESRQDTSLKYGSVSFDRSAEDSLLREQVEREDQFSLSTIKQKNTTVNFNKLHFFSPLRGLVTNSMDLSQNHYGVDIVTGPNEVVKATLDGTIIMAAWTLETGYVIQIQHENNLTSIYKHNAELLKKVGSHVKAGDAIAIIGNSGELTTGPHLHFEIWHNGRPLDPEIYIVF
ncbi:MAG: M23 family metallopeptidase, partial [bacterium]